MVKVQFGQACKPSNKMILSTFIRPRGMGGVTIKTRTTTNKKKFNPIFSMANFRGALRSQRLILPLPRDIMRFWFPHTLWWYHTHTQIILKQYANFIVISSPFFRFHRIMLIFTHLQGASNLLYVLGSFVCIAWIGSICLWQFSQTKRTIYA